MIDFKKLGFSIKTALKGLGVAVREEQTFKIQLGIGILVLFLMFCFPLTRIERAILVLTVSLVLSLELINSQIERILDFLQPNYDPKVKLIKDLSAGAVLLSALGSIIIGLLIFLPYVL